MEAVIMNKKQAEVKVACIQCDIEIGNVEKNTDKTVMLINEACDNGAKLIVLPETCNSGYVFETREEAFLLSQEVPAGETTKSWINVAKERNVYIVAGICERDGSDLYNTAVLVGPEGFIGKYRKLHLWEDEFLWFEPGNMGLPVFHTPIGRIGIIICYDMWFPETFRILASQGADIVCVPTNWVLHESLPNDMKNFGPILGMAAAHSNGIFVAAADRVGVERNVPFPGKSVIIRTAGLPIAGPADDTEQIIYANCNFAKSRKHQSNAYNSTLKDRRTDVYDEMLGYKK